LVAGRTLLTDLNGRPGGLGETALATDGNYFIWMVNIGDIWVADVVDAR